MAWSTAEPNTPPKWKHRPVQSIHAKRRRVFLGSGISTPSLVSASSPVGVSWYDGRVSSVHVAASSYLRFTNVANSEYFFLKEDRKF
jgi:hypothetical protein